MEIKSLSLPDLDPLGVIAQVFAAQPPTLPGCYLATPTYPGEYGLDMG